jgi:hypothetical protein
MLAPSRLDAEQSILTNAVWDSSTLVMEELAHLPLTVQRKSVVKLPLDATLAVLDIKNPKINGITPLFLLLRLVDAATAIKKLYYSIFR